MNRFARFCAVHCFTARPRSRPMTRRFDDPAGNRYRPATRRHVPPGARAPRAPSPEMRPAMALLSQAEMEPPMPAGEARPAGDGPRRVRRWEARSAGAAARGGARPGPPGMARRRGSGPLDARGQTTAGRLSRDHGQGGRTDRRPEESHHRDLRNPRQGHCGFRDAECRQTQGRLTRQWRMRSERRAAKR